MSLPISNESKVGAGKSIVNRHERTYKRGSLMFIEGESSTEMFIIRSGKIRILKQEGENTIELAILGPGSVLGELALLDHQPRSATAQVIEDTVVTIIDDDVFAHTMQRVPPWLGNLVQLVVKRLRDTMKKVNDDLVRKSIAGIIRIIIILSDNEKKRNKAFDNHLLLSKVKDTIFSVIGIGGMEAENVFLHLILKNMILIVKNKAGQEFIEIKNYEALDLYMNYLRAKQRGTPVIGENFTDAAFLLLAIISDAGAKNGKKEGKIIKIGTQQVEMELERNGHGRFMDLDALDVLIDAKILFKEDQRTSSGNMSHARNVILYSPDLVNKVKQLKVWLPVFKEEIRF
jgi:hypothetical protein